MALYITKVEKLQENEYRFVCFLESNARMAPCILTYRNGFFFIHNHPQSELKEPIWPISISVFFGKYSNVHLEGLEILHQLIKDTVAPYLRAAHIRPLNESFLCFHNWLQLGNTERRSQFFRQYNYFLLDLMCVYLLNYAVTVIYNPPHSSNSFFTQSPEYHSFDDGLRLDLLMEKISAEERFFCKPFSLYPENFMLRETDIAPMGLRVDRGDSSVSIMSDLLEIPEWTAKQLRREELYCTPVMDTRPHNNKGVEIMLATEIIVEYGDANFMSHMKAKDIPYLIVFKSILCREIESDVFPALRKKLKREKLSVFLKNWLPAEHKGNEKWVNTIGSRYTIELLVDTLNSVQKFFDKIVEEHGVDRKYAGARLSYHLPDFLGLIKWCNEWHKDIAPFIKQENEYTWHYDMMPVTYTVDGKSYVCKPITSTQELVDEGREQHHCVGTRNESCYQGQSIVFSIRGNDERSTLEYVFENGFVEHCSAWNRVPSGALTQVGKMLIHHIKNNPHLIQVRDVKKLRQEDGPNLNVEFWARKFSAFVDEIKGAK